MNKENTNSRGETPTAELKDKIEGDLGKQWELGGMGDRKGRRRWTRWIQKETLREEKLEN